MKKSIMIIFLMFLVIGNIIIVNAEVNEYAPVMRGDCVTIKQTCVSCSYVNATISYPNSTLAISNEAMVSQGGGVWTYEFCNTQDIGRYDVNGEGDLSGVPTGFSVLWFEVTPNGTILDQAESIILFIVSLGVLLLFIISFYFMIVTPYSNEINEKGAVIKITKLKYVKLGLVLFTWVSFTWVLNILVGISDNFVSLTMYYGFFGFIFDIMNRLALPVGVIVIVIAFFEIIRDADLYDNIKKFGSALK